MRHILSNATTYRLTTTDFWIIVNSDDSPVTQENLEALLQIRPISRICDAIYDFLYQDGSIPPDEISVPVPTQIPNSESDDEAVTVRVESIVRTPSPPTPPSETKPEPYFPTGVFTNRFDEAKAVLIGRSDDNQSTDIYLFINGNYEPLDQNTSANECYPEFQNEFTNELVYLQEEDGNTTLVRRSSVLFSDTYYPVDGYKFSLNSRIARDPDQTRVRVTLEDTTGNTYLHEYALDGYQTTLVAENARNPVTTNTHLIYEKVTDPNVEFYAVPITGSQPANEINSSRISTLPGIRADCKSPAPIDETLIAYVCGNHIYMSEIFGLGSATQHTREPIPDVKHIAYIPNSGSLFSFDDGETIYSFDAATREIQEILRIDIEGTTYMNWR